MAKRNFIPLVPSGTINADASVAQLEQDVLAMDAKVGELAEDIGDTEQEINQLKSDIGDLDTELSYSRNGVQWIESTNWKVGLLKNTVGEEATVVVAFTNRTACDETFTFDRDITLLIASGYTAYVDFVDASNIVLSTITISSSGQNRMRIAAGTKFRVGVQKSTLETVTDIKPYIRALTYETLMGAETNASANDISALQGGFETLGIEWELGFIASSGDKSTSNVGIRTAIAVYVSEDTIIRCINPDSKFQAWTYTGKEIKAANYAHEYSGSILGTYVLKAKKYYAITVQTRDSATISDVSELVNDVEIWTPFYAETKKQNTFTRFPPIGNAKRKIVAHRGCETNAPENTIPSFTDAATGGAWGIETDIQVTSDGYLVCIHDTTLDRTTNGTGDVNSKTLAEIEALHIKDHDDLKVPTLEEYLAICKTYDCVPVMELKNMAGIQTAVTKLITTVRDFGLLSKAVIICSKYSVGYVQCINSDIPLIFNITPSDIEDELFADAVYYFNTNVAIDVTTYTLTEAMVKAAHENGFALIVHSANTASEIKDYLAMGVDVVLSEYVMTF